MAAPTADHETGRNTSQRQRSAIPHREHVLTPDLKIAMTIPTLDFALGDTIGLLRDAVRSFADGEIAPRAAEIDAPKRDRAHLRVVEAEQQASQRTLSAPCPAQEAQHPARLQVVALVQPALSSAGRCSPGGLHLITCNLA